MFGERLPIERMRQEWFTGHRFLARQAAAEVLIQLVLLCPELDFFFTMIGAVENEFTRGGFYADGVKDRLQRNPSPAAVSRKTLGWPSIPGTFEAGLKIRIAQLAQL